MALGKRLFTGGTAACLTETTDIFGDSSGKALYSMDFDASSSGVYDGTPSNVDFGVGGYINTGARFNGSSSIITATQPSGINGPCSYSIWLKTTSSSYQSIITVGSISGSHTAGVNLFVNSGKLSCQTGNGSNTENNTLNSTSNVDTGNWVHCVVTVAGSTQGSAIKIYVNKTNETSGTANNTAIVTATGEKLCLGGRILSGSQSTFLNGSLDQARIFTKELNQQEINTLFDETACVHTSTTDNNDFPVTNVAYYKLDNSAEDSKGTNDGTETNIEYRFGRYGQAAVFNGSSSKITVPAILSSSYTGSVSFSVWFNMSNAASNIYTIINSDDTSPVSGKVILLAVYGGVLELTGYNFATFTKYGTTNVADGNWHNVIVVLDNPAGTFNVYLDGNSTAEITHTNTAGTDLTLDKVFAEDWNIGSQGSIRYFDGSIDQVRIFASTLSPANITSLYNEKPETDTSNFKTVLWNANGASNYISNVGMDLETSGGLVWTKARNQAYNHSLYDSVRGVNKLLQSNTTNTESPLSDAFNSFEANGFFLGANDNSNDTSGGATNSVGWVFKGGGAAVSNGNGSITSLVSANTAAGFSISKGTAPSSSGTFTVGHGLSSTPELVIYKTTDEVGSWITYTATTGASAYLTLNGNAAAVTGSAFFGNTAPTSSVYTLNSGVGLNTGKSFLGLCFHSVAGYQKISTYEGNNSTTGPVVTTGFKPSFVIVKNVDGTGSWNIVDSRRGTLPNSQMKGLLADTNAIEYSSSAGLNFTDTGFEVDIQATDFNTLNETYLYLAIK